MVIDKDNIKILLVLLIVGLGLGYAYINSDLNINGTAQVNHANWDIHWANVQVTNGSVSASSPTISNGTTVNYSVILNQPGDYYEFTVDAVNAGAIDAMIDTITSKLNGATITTLPAYLNYSVTYNDGTPLEQNQELKANTTEKYKVRVEYNTDIELNQLPASNQTLSLQFTVTYRQATAAAQPVRNYLYRSNNNNVNIGDSISSLGTYYTTYQEVVSAVGHNNFLRHRIINNQVVQSDAGYIYNNNVYYLIGGGATYDTSSPYSYLPDSIYYAQNKTVLQSSYGNCTNSSNEGYPYFSCSVSNGFGYASSFGRVRSMDYTNSNWECSVLPSGTSSCSNF